MVTLATSVLQHKYIRITTAQTLHLQDTIQQHMVQLNIDSGMEQPLQLTVQIVDNLVPCK